MDFPFQTNQLLGIPHDCKRAWHLHRIQELSMERQNSPLLDSLNFKNPGIWYGTYNNNL